MKKVLILLFLTCASLAYAQTKISLKFAPLISTNRVSNDSLNAKSDGSKVNFSIGVVVDQPLSDTYYFSSGLVYVPKRVAFIDDSIREEYRVQYLQLPLTLKLFTNEFAPNTKLYFQIGAGLEFKVFDEKTDPSFTEIEKFNSIDIPVILGAGVEYGAGINTILYAGVSYQRGLTNVVGSTATTASEDLKIRNTVLSFDIGIKF
jgi:hypothetical protein